MLRTSDFSVGIVADWFVTFAGSEKVVAELIKIFLLQNFILLSIFYPLRIKNSSMIKIFKLLLFKSFLLLKRNTKRIYRLCH